MGWPIVTELSEKEIAAATEIAQLIEVELKSRRPIDASRHAYSAALVTRLLLIAASVHHGNSSSFVEMARVAIDAHEDALNAGTDPS